MLELGDREFNYNDDVMDSNEKKKDNMQEHTGNVSREI